MLKKGTHEILGHWVRGFKFLCYWFRLLTGEKRSGSLVSPGAGVDFDHSSKIKTNSADKTEVHISY